LVVESSRYVCHHCKNIAHELTVWQLSYPPKGYKDHRLYNLKWDHSLNTPGVTALLATTAGRFDVESHTLQDPRALPVAYLRDDIKRSLFGRIITDNRFLQKNFAVSTVLLRFTHSSGRGEWMEFEITEETWLRVKGYMSGKYEKQPYLMFGLRLVEKGERSFEMP
jgi:hypothetical protein